MITLNELYTLFLRHSVITTDSRNIPPNSLFFALKGDFFNGNTFAEQALVHGAAYSIIDDERYATSASCLLVEDVLTTLQDLSTLHRSKFNIPVIAITGTNGKTTTKELISAVLSSQHSIISTTGNLNNHIGVPLTLLRLQPGVEMAVIEMGANHPGEIDLLSQIAQPTHGLITNIGKAHLEGFGGFEGVVRTKTELYRYLQKNGGTVFVNKNNALLTEHLTGNNTVTYGFDENADLPGKVVHGSMLVELEIMFRESSEIIRSNLFGEYNAENILAAACIGKYFNIPAGKIKEAIEGYIPDNNRSQVKQTQRNLLILDAYNANPSSMEKALNHFAGTGHENKALILGDMLELGAESDQEHEKLLQLINSHHFREVYLIGPVLTRLCTERSWLCFQDSELAKMWFEHHPLTGKTILIKGSRGIKLEKIVEFL